MENLLGTVLQAFPGLCPRRNPKQAGPLALAYIGDTLYDLFVRTSLICGQDLTAHGMHLAAAKKVCAAAQAAAAHRLMPQLTEDELSVYRRGRNAHMGTVAKNASIADYRAATGLEALIGYLYLDGQDQRLIQLMTIALEESVHA